MSTIKFHATPYTIGSWTVLRLPQAASKKLPSRGMSMVEGTINGSHFQSPLEPDGKGSHWFKIENGMKAKAGETATLEIEPMEEWPETKIPADLRKALAALRNRSKSGINRHRSRTGIGFAGWVCPRIPTPGRNILWWRSQSSSTESGAHVALAGVCAANPPYPIRECFWTRRIKKTDALAIVVTFDWSGTTFFVQTLTFLRKSS